MRRPRRTTLQLHPDLETLDGRVLGMGEVAGTLLRDGFAAIQQADAYLARGMVGSAAALADLDESIESAILDTIAAGVDPETARQLLVRVKLITYLNRVGRYGYDLARIVDDAPGLPPRSFDGLAPVVFDTQSMLAEVLDALRLRRAPDLDNLLLLEDRVDAAQHAMMAAWRKATGEVPLQRILVVRALERAADNLCKAAEKLHYAATGQRVVLR